MSSVLFGPSPVETPNGMTWDLPAGWEQGRGAWGGMVVTGVVRAATLAIGDDLPVRSISVQILSPVLAGPTSVEVEPLHTGSNTRSANVRLVQAGEVKANAVVVFGASRVPDLVLHGDDAPPNAAPWHDLPRIPLDGAPRFASHFDLRLIEGAPWQGNASDILGYLLPTDAPTDAVHDAASLLGLVDCYWPSTLTQFAGMRPAATLTFEAYLLVDPADIPADEPLLHHGTTLGVAGGYAAELRRIWSASGTLVAVNLQLVAIIK